MRSLEKGNDKIQKLCNVLKEETIEPAKVEALQIIEDAKEKAHQIISEAEKQSHKLIEDAHHRIEQERNVFKSSLHQAAQQSVEALRQSIEHKLFNGELQSLIDDNSSSPEVLSKLITSIVNAVDKEGIGADLTAFVPKEVSSKDVNKVLAENILKKLRNQEVVIGDFGGGVKLKVHDKKMTIDMSDSAIKELLASYVRKDFREFIFGSDEGK